MKYLILVLMFALAGCGETWTPEQQGAMVNRCHAAGLKYSMGWNGSIHCAP